MSSAGFSVPVLQGQNQGVFLYAASRGESIFNLIQVVGKIQFHVVVGCGPHFFADCHLLGTWLPSKPAKLG